MRSWTAVFTEANHESPVTIRPLPCQGFVSLNIVDVVAPCSACHCFAAIASLPSSATVFASQPIPLGFLRILITWGIPPEQSTFSFQENIESSWTLSACKRGQYLAYLLGSSMTSASRNAPSQSVLLCRVTPGARARIIPSDELVAGLEKSFQ